MALLFPLALAAAALVAAGLARLGFPLPAADRRIGCVDGLRGYLAVSVLVHHGIIWTLLTFSGGARRWQAPGVYAFDQFGAGAVALFFMVTGFVFYPRVLNGFARNDWRAILIGRVFRIMPLIAATVAVIGIILHLRTGARPGLGDLLAAGRWITAWDQPPLLGQADAKLVNAGVLWSLWYEWVFYLLLLPLCAFASDRVRERLPSWSVPAGLLVAALAARVAVLPRHLELYLPLFAVGMIAFEVQARPALRGFFAGRPASLLALVSLGIAMVTAPNATGLPQLALFSLFFIAVACGNTLFGLLTLPGSLVLGECSYGIYLVHGIVLSVLFTEGRELVVGLGDVGALALMVPAAALAALLTAGSFLGVERPMIERGRRLARRLTGHRVTARPAELEVAP